MTEDSLGEGLLEVVREIARAHPGVAVSIVIAAGRYHSSPFHENVNWRANIGHGETILAQSLLELRHKIEHQGSPEEMKDKIAKLRREADQLESEFALTTNPDAKNPS